MGIYKPGRPRCYVPATGRGTAPPSKPGIYRIRSVAGEILYIGETCDLHRRIREHIRSGKISMARSAPSLVEYKVADGRSTSQSRRVHERQKIARHKPSLNRSHGGEGRIAAR